MISPPPLQIPIATPQGGLTTAWLAWFDQLRRVVADEKAFTADPNVASALASLEAGLRTVAQSFALLPSIDYLAIISNLRADLEIGTQPPVVPVQTSNYTTPPTGITPSGSPFTYINQTGYTVDVIVSGGGVSLLEFSRDGATFFSTGSFYGMFTLSPNDRLRATYVAAPTMTLVQR